ncbi:MAG: nuclear transport factor 2 family protein [Acidimicrobiales bacterium]
MPTIDELVAEVARLGRRLDDCEAVLEIQALKARYGELVDRRYVGGRPAAPESMVGLAERIALLFTEDGVWDGGPGLGEATGRHDITERLRQPTLLFARHLFVNPRIEVEGGGARGRWDLLSPCRRPDGSSYWMCGYEEDEYLRVNGTWLHRTMRLTTVFMSPVGEGWENVLA